MTDYQMPVLTEREKEIYIDTIKTHMRSISEEADENLQFEYDVLKIALAALTAEPVDPADCFQSVYLVPPLPVIKQEGE